MLYIKLFLEANQAPYLAKLVFITGIIRMYIWIYDRYIYVNEDLWNISLEYVLDTNMGYIELEKGGHERQLCRR